MKHAQIACLTGCVVALIAVLAVTPGSWTYYRFKTDRYDYASEAEALGASVKLFGATMAGFYMTGGNPEGLNSFPANPLVKRRVFMDLNGLLMSKQIFVMDRDTRELRDLVFLSPVHAVVVTDENWFFAYQDAETRRPLSTKKFSKLTIRYYMKKKWGKWIVMDYDVFDREDTLPPLLKEKILQW